MAVVLYSKKGYGAVRFPQDSNVVLYIRPLPLMPSCTVEWPALRPNGIAVGKGKLRGRSVRKREKKDGVAS